jgi:hypothetical protein
LAIERETGDNLMADESDVENTLVSLAAAALYPSGAGTQSVPGPDCRIYRGWPNASALNADLAAGRINVTVFPIHGVSAHARTTTRYTPIWAVQSVQPTLTATVLGASVTFGGSADLGQLAGVLVSGQGYSYRTQVGDNTALVAANLAERIRPDMIVQLSGSTVTIPNVGTLLARVVADATAQQEIRRQELNFRVTCWCPTPATRDVAATAIDISLAQVPFVPLPDGSSARVTYYGTAVLDQSENALLYRRDLLYRVEYPTMLTASQPAMLFGDLLLNAADFKA